MMDDTDKFLKRLLVYSFISVVAGLYGLNYFGNCTEKIEREKKKIPEFSKVYHSLVVLKHKEKEKYVGYDNYEDNMTVRYYLKDDYVKQIYYDLDGDSTNIEAFYELDTKDFGNFKVRNLVAKGFAPARGEQTLGEMTEQEYEHLNSEYKKLMNYNLVNCLH